MRRLIGRLTNFPLAVRVSLISRVGLLVLNFATALIAARLYGPVANGQIGLLVALLGVTSVLSLGGHELLILRSLPGEREDRNELLTASLIRVSIGALVVGLGFLFIVVPFFGENYEAKLGPQLVKILPLVAAINAFRVFFFETMRSREDIVAYSLLNIVGPLALFLMLPVLPRLVPGISFAWLVVVSELLGIIAVLAMFLANSRGLKLVKITRGQIATRAWPYFVSTCSIAAYTMDILLVGLLVSPHELGIYVIASRFAGIVSMPKNIFGISFAPQLARVLNDTGLTDAIALARQNTRTLSPYACLLAVLFLVAGPFILALLGPDFREGYPVLVLIVLANLALTLAGDAGMLLMMAGHDKLQQHSFFFSTSAMIIVLFLLVPSYGIIGGGIALVVGAIVRSLLGTIAVAKLYGTGVSAFHVYFGKGGASALNGKE